MAPGRRGRVSAGKRGFDRVFIHGGGGIGQSYPGSCGDAPGNTYFDPAIRSDGEFVRTKGYCTDVFFEAALDWIDRCRHGQKPFFCYLTPNCPHDPYDCPPGSDAKYLGPLERAGIKDPKQRATIARFYAMIENIDTNMGRLLGKLDEWGLAEETLVVFSTDNGTAAGATVSNDQMRGQKGSPYRGGTRVPAFWRWPGTLPAGVDVPAVTAHIDVLPTLSELAGVTIPPAVAAKVEGRSLVPLLEDAEAEWPDRLLVTHVGRWERGRAAESAFRNCRIRAGRWQLVNTQNRPDSWELYDLAADPGEQRNVAAEHPDVAARLGKAYDAWWASVQGDLVNENLDGPKENPFQVAFRQQFGPDSSAAPADEPQAVKPARPAPQREKAAVVPPVPPTLADVRYGEHPKQRLHFWKAPGATAENPAPLVFSIHGGGWQHGDPVARESMRLLTAAVTGARTSLDPKQMQDWTPNSRYGGHAFGFMKSPAQRDSQFAEFLAARERLLPWIARYSPNILFILADDQSPFDLEAYDPTSRLETPVLDALAAREAAGDTDPFLIYYGFSHPHDTRDGTPELLAKYGATNHTDQSRPPPLDQKQPPLPGNWLPRHPFDTTHLDVRDKVAASGVWRRRDEATVRNEIGREFACRENIDRQIGRVLDKLRAMGELDNTWIVSTADHGMAIGRHGLQGKRNLYEHTWRVPLIVAGPGVKPGSRSVRQGDWKLVKYESPAGGLVTQLFNLRENPEEFLQEHRDPAVTAISHAAPEESGRRSEPGGETP